MWTNPKHGTSTGYGNYRCRCDECRAWNASQGRNRRKAKPEEGRAYASAYYRARPHLRRGQTLKRYAFTAERYAELLAEQGGVCAICGMSPSDSSPLQIDHDHGCCKRQNKSCGRCVRGLLCKLCNTGIALLCERPEILLRAIEYLNRSKSMNTIHPEEIRNVAD